MQKVIIMSTLTLFLASCGTTGGPNQTAGTLLGAAGGALIGSQFGGGSGKIASTAIGTLGGALLGGYIGKQADESEQYHSSPRTYYGY